MSETTKHQDIYRVQDNGKQQPSSESVPPVAHADGSTAYSRARALPTPRNLLALQRAVGNRVTGEFLATRVVQRQSPPAPPPDKNPPLDPSMFQVTGGGPVVAGTTTASLSSDPVLKGTVMIRAPIIDLNQDVALKDDLATGISVGFVQTLMASTRAAIYGRGGKELFRKTITTPQSRDVEPQKNVSGKSIGGIRPGETANPPAPFFSWPRTISKKNIPETLTFHDQPSFPAESREGDATLIGTDGHESFTLSVVAHDVGTGQTVHLKSVTWSFSWQQTIDSSGTGGGGKGIVWAPSATGAPIMTDGVIARSAGRTWYDFQSEAAALAAPIDILLRNVSLAKAAGPDGVTSLANTVTALRRLNPFFQLQVVAETTSSIVGSDTLSVTVKGTGSITTRIAVSEDAPNSVGFNLLTIFGSPDEIDKGVTVSITVLSDILSSAPGVASFKSIADLRSGRTVKTGSMGGGSYRLSANF